MSDIQGCVWVQDNKDAGVIMHAYQCISRPCKTRLYLPSTCHITDIYASLQQLRTV